MFYKKEKKLDLDFCHAGHLQILAKLSDKEILHTKRTTVVHAPPDLKVIVLYVSTPHIQKFSQIRNSYISSVDSRK